jgi:anthranilate synthase component 1
MRLRDIYPQSALMESSDYHGSENATSRLSASIPMASIQVSHGRIIMLFPDGKREERIVPVENSSRPKETVAKALNDFMHAFHIEGEGSQHYGIFGYTAANAVRYFENIPVKDTTMERNDAPDMLYLLFKRYHRV